MKERSPTRTRKPRKARLVGPEPKNPDLVTVDACGANKEAEGNTYIKVNLLRRLTEDDLKKDKFKSLSTKYFECLVPIAAVLLAVPAAEAVDEFAFSSAGSRAVSMLPQTLEQVTVIRRFNSIQSGGSE